MKMVRRMVIKMRAKIMKMMLLTKKLKERTMNTIHNFHRIALIMVRLMVNAFCMYWCTMSFKTL